MLLYHPAPNSKIEPVSSHDSWDKYATNGTMYDDFKFANASGGITVSVILDAATGAIEFARIFFFSPSFAIVYVNPWIPNLAALH